MANIRLVTTKWSLQPRDQLEANERNLATEEKFWKPLLTRGAEIARFADTWESAMEILRPLVRGKPFVPLLLKERVFDGLTMAETHAGQVVNDKVEEAVKAGKKELEKLDEAWKEAAEMQEDAWAAELLKEKQLQEANLKKWEEERSVLHAQNSQRSRGRFWRWAARGSAALVGGIATLLTGGIAGPAALALYGAVETGAQIHKRSSD
jgi:hypothetical protein